jgi:hypothetical protein
MTAEAALETLLLDVQDLPHDDDGFVAVGAVLGLIHEYLTYIKKAAKEDELEMTVASLSERLETVELKIRELDPRKDN